MERSVSLYQNSMSGDSKISRAGRSRVRGSKSLLDLSFLAGNNAKTFRNRERNQFIVSTFNLLESTTKNDLTIPLQRVKSKLTRATSVDSVMNWNNDAKDSSSSDTVVETVEEEISEYDEYDTDSVFTDEVNSSDDEHGLKHLSRSTPTMSPSGSPPHSDSEGHVHISRRTKKFLQRFRSVPSTERVINYYACAIVSDILLQGTLYITDNYFAFYSNIFGYVNRTLIPISDVCSIQKEKTAKFIPNAVGLTTADGKTFVFSSLISRDTTYKFMTHMWRKYRKLTDSDIESTLPVQEEPYINDSCSNSGDSAVDDGNDYVDSNHLSPTSVVAARGIGWSDPTPLGTTDVRKKEGSLTNSENESSYTTPETCISSTSFNELKSSGDIVGTSGSENDRNSERKDNNLKKLPKKDTSRDGSSISWSEKANIIQGALSFGVAPFRAVKDGLQELTLADSNLLLIISSSLVLILFLSAAFMIYRVESLNEQMSTESFQYGNLYEEVLRMQQKLHSATASEIEKTLSHQIKQLATVKKSLEALVFLLNTDTRSSSQVQEPSYQTI